MSDWCNRTSSGILVHWVCCLREAWKICGLELGREELEEPNSVPQGKGGKATVTPLLKGSPALGARVLVLRAAGPGVSALGSRVFFHVLIRGGVQECW